MKKLILVLTCAFLGMGLQAQEGFKLGIHGGLPIDDFNDNVSLMLGFDTGYMYALGEVVDLGVMTGFIHGFAEKFDSDTIVAGLPNMQFIPMAASIRVWPSNSISLGVDGGYALGINEGNDGGLYYKPILGYLMGPYTEVNFSYTTVDMDDVKWNSLNIGILYTFPSKRRL